MNKTKISAKIVADSINGKGDRITTMLVTFPRYILAELNTHRMLSKNSASSRAIPFKKMVKSVQDDPFIPIAWQKDHTGMQGTEYLNASADDWLIIKDWLSARDNAVEVAKSLNKECVTKQICNRLLEPFMWHTVLITATEWENFFKLRCPSYDLYSEQIPRSFRSKKDALDYIRKIEADEFKSHCDNLSDLDWLQCNSGKADIHMMLLAEAMWDAMNENVPKQLFVNEWHIPFGDMIDDDEIYKKYIEPFNFDRTKGRIDLVKVKIASAMAARTSYTVIGEEKEFGYDKQIELHDRMVNQVPFHASPFEHCARSMDQEEYDTFIKGRPEDGGFFKEDRGWCNNFKGFIQYRYILED